MTRMVMVVLLMLGLLTRLATLPMIGMTLVTPQTGPEGKKVRRLLVEEGLGLPSCGHLGA